MNPTLAPKEEKSDKSVEIEYLKKKDSALVSLPLLPSITAPVPEVISCISTLVFEVQDLYEELNLLANLFESALFEEKGIDRMFNEMKSTPGNPFQQISLGDIVEAVSKKPINTSVIDKDAKSSHPFFYWRYFFLKQKVNDNLSNVCVNKDVQAALATVLSYDQPFCGLTTVPNDILSNFAWRVRQNMRESEHKIREQLKQNEEKLNAVMVQINDFTNTHDTIYELCCNKLQLAKIHLWLQMLLQAYEQRLRDLVSISEKHFELYQNTQDRSRSIKFDPEKDAEIWSLLVYMFKLGYEVWVDMAQVSQHLGRRYAKYTSGDGNHMEVLIELLEQANSRTRENWGFAVLRHSGGKLQRSYEFPVQKTSQVPRFPLKKGQYFLTFCNVTVHFSVNRSGSTLSQIRIHSTNAKLGIPPRGKRYNRLITALLRIVAQEGNKSYVERDRLLHAFKHQIKAISDPSRELTRAIKELNEYAVKNEQKEVVENCGQLTYRLNVDLHDFSV